MNKKLKIITLLVVTGLMALSLVSFAKSTGVPLMPMTIYGYVTIQKGDGTNMTAPNLTVYAKVQNTTIPNNAETVGLTDNEGKYIMSVGSGDNTVPPEGTPIDIWVQGTNVTRIVMHYGGIIDETDGGNLTVVDTTSPIIQVLYPLSGSTVSSSLPLWINATVTDNLLINETSIHMTLNQTQLAWTFNNATGLLTNQTGPPTPGTYVANITVTDIAGNTAVQTWSFKTGIVAPSVTITSPTTANQVYTKSGKPVQVIFTYTEPNPLNWTIVISNAAHTVPSLSNGTAITPGSGTVTASVQIDQSATDGLYNVAVTMYNTNILSNTTTQTNAVLIDNTPPTIGTPTQVPSSNVQPTDTVNISASVTDGTGSGVYNVTLSYNVTGSWNDVPMSLNATSGLWQGSIPPQAANNTVQYKITAYDKVGNNATNNNAGAYYVYKTIPEFPTITLLMTLMAFTAIFAVIVKRRKAFKP